MTVASGTPLPITSFPTDYDSIRKRIEKVDPVHYAITRNYIDGNVSYLSPYISRGVISVRQVRDIILAKGYAAGAIGKFLQELAWREYFQRVWQSKGEKLFEDITHPQNPVVHREMISAVVNSTTGIASIDQSIDHLYQTGYMHNHMRMYVASITCNVGLAHWSAPARWMYANLLDGDLASNTCSWQWVTGTFASKKYYCNQDNINHFTKTYQQNTFLDVAHESLPKVPIPMSLKSTMTWSLQTKLPVFAKPIIDPDLPTLVYNSYNLDPSWRKNEKVNRILLLEPSHFRKYPVTSKVMEFVLSLAKNIPGIQVFTAEFSELSALYGTINPEKKLLISKEHPAFAHYSSVRDERDWIYPTVSGYFPSFSSFWKQCSRARG